MSILHHCQIETQEAVENIDAILSVEGIDVGLIGPNDLSISLGIPDQMNSETLLKAIDRSRGDSEEEKEGDRYSYRKYRGD